MGTLKNYIKEVTGVELTSKQLGRLHSLVLKASADEKKTVQEKYGIDEDFALVVIEWLEYKKERRESYKSPRSIKAFITRLQNLSGNDLEKAKRIIQISIANNWAGIFELKENGKNKQQQISQGFKESILRDLQSGIDTANS